VTAKLAGRQLDLTSPPSVRIALPVIRRAPADTRNAIRALTQFKAVDVRHLPSAIKQLVFSNSADSKHASADANVKNSRSE